MNTCSTSAPLETVGPPQIHGTDEDYVTALLAASQIIFHAFVSKHAGEEHVADEAAALNVVKNVAWHLCEHPGAPSPGQGRL
jgi:hypothetical protein